ncbi:deoxyxylulose-5-phosphate synthase [Streptomyces sp. NPDC048172]|uniref:deoxyxylulose-5-phosphate synthase n=1 Tax=Streptomyces sp. NPDC048172 TaxID=3365505 RepID=UPI0037116841
MPGILNTHVVCTPCRSAFKRPLRAAPARCAFCGGDMIDAGPQLAVPGRRDTDGWRALAVVLSAGVRFPAVGCEAEGPGYRPRTMREVQERVSVAERTGRSLAEVLTDPDPWS